MFRRRLVTVVAGAPVMVAALYAGGFVWAAVLVVIAVWGALELGDLFVAKGAGQPARDVLALAGMAGVAMAPLVQMQGTRHWAATAALLLAAVPLAYAAVRAWSRGRSVLLESAAAVFAFSYVGVLLGFWWLLRSSDGIGWPYALLALAGTWGTDIGAYLVGRRWGRRPLLPRLSPSKTVEGAVGGLLAGEAVVMATGSMAFGMEAGRLGILGLVVALAAELGDLVESALKRDANVKDSGWLLPGHGGILDRMDSVLLVGPAAYLFLVMMVRA